MFEHHSKAIEALTEHLRKEEDIIALLFGGSVMHGLAKSDSDVDLMIILTDEAYEKRKVSGNLWYYSTDSNLINYKGGYFDGKYMSMQFLRDAADRGSDPTRWSFENAMVAFTRDVEVYSLVKAIATYPEALHEARVKSFFAQVTMFGGFFMGESDKRGEIYLTRYASTHFVLFVARLILAMNRKLFTSHKWMMHMVETCEQKPEGIVDDLKEILNNPTKELSGKIVRTLTDFYAINYSFDKLITTFISDSEQNWINTVPPLEDC